jgi:hypothetical protein
MKFKAPREMTRDLPNFVTTHLDRDESEHYGWRNELDKEPEVAVINA